MIEIDEKKLLDICMFCYEKGTIYGFNRRDAGLNHDDSFYSSAQTILEEAFRVFHLEDTRE